MRQLTSSNIIGKNLIKGNVYPIIGIRYENSGNTSGILTA
jgi:hypothetical protein